MKNIKKHYTVACLAAMVSASLSVAVQAGTSRSLGGHSMVNARNYSASRNFGSHNFGGSTHSSTIDKGTIADFITSNGGTITKSKADGKASIAVITGDGATFSANATKATSLKGITLTYGTSAKTLKGKTYTGSGKTELTRNKASIGLSSAHSGTGSINVSSSSTGTLTKDAQTINRTVSAGAGSSTYNSTLAIQNNASGTLVNHHETGSLNVQGTPLKQTDTTTIVTATPGQQTKFEHIDAITGWDYVTYFDPVHGE